MQFRLYRANELPAKDRAAWHELQAAVDAFRSPYFHPAFTEAVTRVRDDVEVAVMSLGTEIVGFFPFQRGPRNSARPVGGRLSDFHGVIVNPGVPVDVDSLFRACRVRSFAYDHLITAHQPFSPSESKREGSPWVDLSRGFDEYRKHRTDAGSSEIRQTERKFRKLEREVGPTRIEMHTKCDEAWQKLLKWKSSQYHETGKSDVFSFPWTVQLLKTISAQSTEEFGAMFSSLWIGEQLLAVHYSMRCRHVLHSWFPAYDREFSRYSPGNILLMRMAQECESYGIQRIDMGKGDEQYKLGFATSSEIVAEGFAGSDGWARLAQSAWNGARNWVKATPWLRSVAEVPLRLIRPLRERRSFQ